MFMNIRVLELASFLKKISVVKLDKDHWAKKLSDGTFVYIERVKVKDGIVVKTLSSKKEFNKTFYFMKEDKDSTFRETKKTIQEYINTLK